MRRKGIRLLCCAAAWLMLTGCAIGGPEEAAAAASAAAQAQLPAMEDAAEERKNATMKMNLQLGEHTFTASLEGNDAAAALTSLLEDGPLEVGLRDYAGFEKVGPLGISLPASDSLLTTRAGDIVLYQGDQIVLFYGANTWQYTLLGRIDDITGWAEALGDGDVTMTLSLAK